MRTHARFELQEPCLYIREIRLQNIRSFEDVRLDLASGSDIRKWAIALGNNGVGKSSLLRAIAMGLCDRDSAAGLLRDINGEWIRKNKDSRAPSEIDVTLTDGRKSCSIVTTFKRSPGGFETVDQRTVPQDGFPWHRIFVCAYGANRTTEGSMDYEEYKVADAVYTLFNYDWSLQNPELALRRRAPRKAQQKSVCRWLDHILMLPNGSVQLNDYGITIDGGWGKDIYLGALADGYVGTLTWVLDMIGWAMLAGVRSKPRGIVLVDELEQHLHPKLQRHVVRALRKMFPDVQFVATTHAPLCAGGAADLADEDYTVGVLRRTETGTVEIDTDIPSLSGLRADQILTLIFDLLETRNVRVADKVIEYRRLLGKPVPSRGEEERLKKLRAELRGIPDVAQLEEERKLRAELQELLERIEKSTRSKGK